MGIWGARRKVLAILQRKTQISKTMTDLLCKNIVIILFFIFSIPLCAQGEYEDIKVESFTLSTTTNYANLEGSIEYDDNGEKCALIIVDTKYPDRLTFNGGSLGIKKVVTKTGQAWVYVPDGLKRITISGEGIGTLRDYDLGVSVKKARTYILKLTTKDVETIVFNDAIQADMKIAIVSAKDGNPIRDAEISINGIKETLDNDGVLIKNLSGATYRYRVDAKYYKTESGTFIVDGKNNEHIIKMKPNYEIATIKAPQGCEIWIDGQLMSNGSWKGRLLLGTHNILCKLDKHYDEEQILTVVEGKEAELTLEMLKEIQGTLNITSMPDDADVLVDGRKVGTTPYKRDIIIGEHTVEVAKSGYSSVKENITIIQNQQQNVNAILKQTHKVVISTSPVRASVTVDGKHLGTTPLGVDMRSGTHEFEVKAQGYYTLRKDEKIGDNQTKINFHLKKQRYKPNEFYFGGGYSLMPISGIQGHIGGYFSNINAELGYWKSLKDSEPIYWYTSNPNVRPVMATYSSTAYKLRFGYGIALNNTLRITPQLGLSHVVLEESADSEEAFANGAYSTNFNAGVKIDMAITKWVSLTVTPDYSMAVKKSVGIDLLEGMSDHIKTLSNGFGVHANINVRF